MLSLKRLEREDREKKQNKKIELELPYFITIVTLLATSGLGPYTIFQKIKDIHLLPAVRAESVKLLNRIDLLGIDPLTALSQAKDNKSSSGLGEFLNGYVSSIQSGGNVINYLKSKMNSVFEKFVNAEKQSVEKISALVHAYLTMQIVILAVFILIASIGSNPISGSTDSNSGSNSPYYLLILSPIISAVFMKLAQNMNYSHVKELEIKKILRFAIPSILIALILVFTNILSSLNGNAYLVGVALIIASIWPTLKFKKIYALNLDAEKATPQILRDITEARKAGIGPEKCITHACKRKDFKLFNSIANSISSKLEWGIPLANIFSTLQQEIKNFQVLISFRILFEVISSGGGNVNTLDSLADTSEKIYNAEKAKQDALKPFVIIGFMLIGITGFTTLLVIDSFAEINQQKLNVTKNGKQNLEPNSLMELFSISLLIQSWLAGLFIGKITTGSYSGGFQYSIFLIIITIIDVVLVQSHIIDINSMFKTS